MPARKKQPCQIKGCELLTGGLSGYCAVHHAAAKKCVIDDCENMVAGWSRSGCCNEHRVIARKLL